MPTEYDSEDCDLVLKEARKLAIEFQHGFIDDAHVFVAMLIVDCLANKFCTGFNKEKWIIWLRDRYPAIGSWGEEDSLPITLVVEYTIKHARKIARKCDEDGLNSVHLLLALIVPAHDIAAAFGSVGITFEDILAGYGKPVFGKFPPPWPYSREQPYSKWDLLFLSAASRKKKAGKLHHLAYQFWLYEQYDRCITACRVGLSLDPDYKEFKVLQALCFQGQRNFPACIDMTAQLLAIEPGDKVYRMMQSYSYNELGDYLPSAAILDELLSAYPEDDALWNNTGFNLSLQGKYAESIPFFEKAIALNSSFAYAWNNMGFAQCKAGSIREGLAAIDKSLQLDRGNSYAYKNKGIILFGQGNKTEALKNFQLALKFNYTQKYGNEVAEWMARFD